MFRFTLLYDNRPVSRGEGFYTEEDAEDNAKFVRDIQIENRMNNGEFDEFQKQFVLQKYKVRVEEYVG